jgi:uncharacterized membrane protein
MDGALFVVTLVTALGCALSAGALFAFSSFVMPALARLPAPQGIAAMQSINVKAVTPAFMAALFGSAIACVVLAIWALVDWDGSYSPWLLVGSGLYLAGPIGLTMGYHVPRNNALAAVEPSAPDAEARWRRYVVEWTRGNHLRVAAGLAAAAALIGAIDAG